MDFGKAFSYQFQDPKWVEKILITALISLIPVFGGLYLVGWALADIRRVMNGEAYPMPETDFGGHFMRGLKWAIVQFVYAIPAILVFVIVAILGGFSANQQGSGNILFLAVCCINIVVLLYLLILAFFTPIIQIVFLEEGESIGAGFHFSRIIAVLRAAPGAYGLAFLGTIIGGIIAPIGGILFGVGALVTTVYAESMMSHLIGQAYLETGKA
jgi:fumarate reductase subunit D